MRRLGILLPAAVLGLLVSAGPVLACGGLIGPNGAVNLLRTTTFAGYHGGEEHYVTAFEFAGGGGAFGSITPLPGVPSSVEKGGDWTLQRLILETEPARRARPRRPRGPRRLRGRGADEGPDRRPRHHRAPGRRRRHRRVGQGPRLPPPAGRAGGARLLRQPEPDLPRRRVRRGCREVARPAGRRRHAGPHHDPDRQPVGAAAHPGPGQDGRGTGRRGRLPPHRPYPGAPARADGRQRHPPRPQRAGDDVAPRRPAERSRHGLGARLRRG